MLPMLGQLAKHWEHFFFGPSTVEETQFVQNTNKIDTNASKFWQLGIFSSQYLSKISDVMMQLLLQFLNWWMNNFQSFKINSLNVRNSKQLFEVINCPYYFRSSSISILQRWYISPITFLLKVISWYQWQIFDMCINDVLSWHLYM